MRFREYTDFSCYPGNRSLERVCKRDTTHILEEENTEDEARTIAEATIKVLKPNEAGR